VRAIIDIFSFLLALYEVLLLLRILLSWVGLDPYANPITRFLYNITEPLLEPIRSVLPPVGMIDFSPMVAFVLIIALQRALSILAAGL
jgi:YggT family protein